MSDKLEVFDKQVIGLVDISSEEEMDMRIDPEIETNKDIIVVNNDYEKDNADKYINKLREQIKSLTCEKRESEKREEETEIKYQSLVNSL